MVFGVIGGEGELLGGCSVSFRREVVFVIIDISLRDSQIKLLTVPE